MTRVRAGPGPYSATQFYGGNHDRPCPVLKKWTRLFSERRRSARMVAVSWITRLLAEWHEVKLKYSTVSMRCVPLSLVRVVTGQLGLACNGVGVDSFRLSCQEAAQGTNPSNYR